MSETCIGCELIARRTAGHAPVWDSIYRTELFDVVHAYGTTLPGWIVILPLRHVEAVHELSDEESIEVGILIRQVSRGLVEIVDCQKTYVMQFAEAEGHQHVHFHVTPRYRDIEPENKGPNIFNTMKMPGEVPEAERNLIGAALRDYLKNNLPDR